MIVVVDGDDVVGLGEPPVTKLGSEKVGVEETGMEHDDRWARGIDVGFVGVW